MRGRRAPGEQQQQQQQHAMRNMGEKAVAECESWALLHRSQGSRAQQQLIGAT